MNYKENEKMKLLILKYLRGLKRVVTRNGLKEIRSDKVKVGDVLCLATDQRVPIDSLLLHTSDPLGSVFVRTDQLDGETDWKIRESVRFTQNLVKNEPMSIFDQPWNAVVEPPRDLIYDFDGNFFSGNDSYEPIRIENTIWAHMKIATGAVLVLTIYTGRETRMAMNSKEAVDKFGKTDNEINHLFKIIFVILLLVSISFFVLSGSANSPRWAIEIVRVFSILSTLLPFMLKLNVDFAKLFYSYEINKDPVIEGTVVRNRQIPEELGRVEYLLSDKTGTLTRNEMIFKCFHTPFGFYNNDSFADLRMRLTQVANNSDKNSAKDLMLKESVVALILCNNVSPTFVNGQRMLQASSPDEVALVNFAESLGYSMQDRKTNSILIRMPAGEIQQFDILENFAFSSERKRMGILVRHRESQQLIFYLKGADSALQTRVDSKDQIFLEEECDNLSKEGLRTLVISQKILSEVEYRNWKAKMKTASVNLKKRADEERKCIEELENNMKLLGVTGVEDLLQEDVKQVIATIRNAGIKVWMLTGDKLETAKCIAISTGFKSTGQRFHDVLSMNPIDIQDKLERFDPDFSVLVIPGNTLEVILDSHQLKKLFIEKSLQAKSVVLCRCAPKQKAEVGLILKNECGKTVCGVGDGGNDVGMIQSASIGIGIEGKEGLQASLASDFSIKKFKYLMHLFLWHGRLSYVRTSVLANLVIHRGFIVTTIQYLFMIAFYFITMNIYNGYLNMFYGTVFTNLLVFSMIFDVDIPKHQVFNYPILYRLIQEGNELSLKMFCFWVFKAIFQGSVIILLALYLFDDPFLEIITITFTALLLTEYLTIAIIVRTWHRMIFVGLLLSFLSYLICLLFFNEAFLLSQLSLENYSKIVFLVICGWLPFAFIYLCRRKCCPSVVDKIVMEARTLERRKQLESRKSGKSINYL